MRLALVDYDYKFIWADIGGRGAASDAQLWNESDLKAATEVGELGIPPSPGLTLPSIGSLGFWHFGARV